MRLLDIFTTRESWRPGVFITRGLKLTGDEYTVELTLIGLQKNLLVQKNQGAKTPLWFIY